MKQTLLILILALSLALDGHAQKKMTIKKQFTEARAAIKKKSGQEGIEKILLDSIALPTTPDNLKAEGYHLCALLEQSMNDGLNMNAYLKKNIDTVRFYRTVHNIYAYTLKSDSLDHRGKFRGRNRKLRTLHRQNLLGGGKYHLRASKWSEAYPYFDLFLSTCVDDMGQAEGKVAYWATVCGMNENNPHHVLRHVDKAIGLMPEAERPALAEYKARACVGLGDSARWLGILEHGVVAYTGHNYFFLNLMDYYMRHGQVERGMALTDSLVKNDGDRAVYWFAMSLFALHVEDYDKCIHMSDECLSREPDNVDALYNKGISLLNLALNEESAPRRMQFYLKAREPMERMRELSPEDVARWGTPLYRIYLNLNMGEKFEEIDSLLQQHPEVNSQFAGHNSQLAVPAGDVETERAPMDKRIGN